MTTQTKNSINNNNDILTTIESRIQQAQEVNPHTRTSQNAKLLYPAKPADIAYNILLYQHLDATKNNLTNYSRDLHIEKNKLTKIPLFGKIMYAMQRQLHQIALFYTNRALRYQLEINQHLLESIGQLTIENQKQQRLITNLQEQLK